MRAIQAGAKADLQLLAEAQAAFRKEYGFYSSDLGSLPFRRKDLKNVLYKFGFIAVKAPPVGAKLPIVYDPSRIDLDALRAARKDIVIGYSDATRIETVDLKSLAAAFPDCVAGDSSFKAIAAANLDDDADLDVWTLDSAGNLVHANDDLKR